MKRSEINRRIRDAEEFFAACRFLLPPFAFWSPREWAARAGEAEEVKRCGLGWDLTDFGSGDFDAKGLLLFTLRNGAAGGREYPKPYAEKIMIVGEDQLTPLHFHWRKMEDIINRGGGSLVLTLYTADEREGLGAGEVTVRCDGVPRRVDAGGEVVLAPGESITLPQRLYHSFRGEAGKGRVLAGEVSMVNDDAEDNRFHEPCGRFPAIEEDEEPYRLLVGDYAAAGKNN